MLLDKNRSGVLAGRLYMISFAWFLCSSVIFKMRSSKLPHQWPHLFMRLTLPLMPVGGSMPRKDSQLRCYAFPRIPTANQKNKINDSLFWFSRMRNYESSKVYKRFADYCFTCDVTKPRHKPCMKSGRILFQMWQAFPRLLSSRTPLADKIRGSIIIADAFDLPDFRSKPPTTRKGWPGRAKARALPCQCVGVLSILGWYIIPSMITKCQKSSLISVFCKIISQKTID